MKLMLEHLINKIHKEELELLFGSNSKIVIDSIDYSTNNKSICIHTTLYSNEIEDSIQSFPDGVDYLIQESWKYIGIKENLTIVKKIDII